MLDQSQARGGDVQSAQPLLRPDAERRAFLPTLSPVRLPPGDCPGQRPHTFAERDGPHSWHGSPGRDGTGGVVLLAWRARLTRLEAHPIAPDAGPQKMPAPRRPQSRGHTTTCTPRQHNGVSSHRTDSESGACTRPAYGSHTSHSTSDLGVTLRLRAGLRVLLAPQLVWHEPPPCFPPGVPD